jgi:hypothetical protein
MRVPVPVVEASIPVLDAGRGGDQAEEREDAAVVPLNFGQSCSRALKNFSKSAITRMALRITTLVKPNNPLLVQTLVTRQVTRQVILQCMPSRPDSQTHKDSVA